MDKQKFFETLQQARKLSELTLKAMEKKEKSEVDGLEEVFGNLIGAFEDAGSFLNTTFARLDVLGVSTLYLALQKLEDEYGAYLGLNIEEGDENVTR